MVLTKFLGKTQTATNASASRGGASDADDKSRRGKIIRVVLALVVIAGSIGSFFLPGCNRKALGPVSGRVTFQGKPVSDGASIYFCDNLRGTHMTALLDKDGTYRVEMAEGFGLPPGQYDVAILPPVITLTAAFIEQQKGKSPYLAKFPSIPLRYRDPKTSRLNVVVEAAGTTFDVDMTP